MSVPLWPRSVANGLAERMERKKIELVLLRSHFNATLSMKMIKAADAKAEGAVSVSEHDLDMLANVAEAEAAVVSV